VKILLSFALISLSILQISCSNLTTSETKDISQLNDAANQNKVITAKKLSPTPQAQEPSILPLPGPIDLSVLDDPAPIKKKITTASEDTPITPKKNVSPFRAPDATQNLVGETEANRISIDKQIKSRLDQAQDDKSTIIARPPSN